MTNKQTNIRSSCWSITSYGEELQYLKRVQTGDEVLPDFVKRLWGGEEMCPKTERLHFQGCIETSECRFSQVKKWLPKSHIEKAFKRQALVKYVMKEESATSNKEVVENEFYMSVPQIVEQLVRIYRLHDKDQPTGGKGEYQILFDNFVYRHGVQYIGILSDVRTYRTYKMSCKVVFRMLTDGKI